MHEKTLGTRKIYEGRVLNLEVLDIEMENGVRSYREIVRHRGAAAVVARAADGRFVFVRQYRKPIERECLEIVAGLLEPNESPEDCIRRELVEETGYRAARLVRVGTVYPTPGYTDEQIALFYAELEEEQGPRGLDEDEGIELVVLSRSEVEKKIEQGQLQDGKTLAAWLLYAKMPAEQ